MVSHKQKPNQFEGKEKEKDVTLTNILAACGVSDFIRTSLGPKGMDKMVISEKKDVIVSNDGATILDNLEVIHPIAKMLVELSKSQDSEAGDGTTSVVILCGALLKQSKILIEKGIHPNIISEYYGKFASRVPEILKNVATGVSIDDDDTLTNAAITSLSSKIVSPESALLAPIAVKAVKAAMTKTNNGYDLEHKSIRIITKLGGTIEDSKLINGLVFNQKASHVAGGPTLIKNAKIALIQFQLSPPKTDMDFNLTVRKNEEIDRLHKDERRYAAKLVQRIAKSGCNVLLIQKSIIRDATSPLALHFLARKKIMVVSDIEREDVEFITKSLGCRPIAALRDFHADKLGSAESATETRTPDGSLIQILGVKTPGAAVSILLRGSSGLVLSEAKRSLHDAICVVRCLVRSPHTVPGGASAEAEIALRTREAAKKAGGVESLCAEAFADALETIPETLAENCGLRAVHILSQLRDKHAEGCASAGIDVRRARVGDFSAERVIQPALVTESMIALAVECARMILKIDGIVQTARD